MWQPLIDQLSQQGYAIIPQCFDPALIQALRVECLQREADFVPAQVGRHASQQRDPKIRGDYTLWFEPPYSAAQLQYLEHMETLRQALNREFYLGLFDYEVHFAHYPQGSAYRKHLDQFKNSSLRRITTLTYLNPDWQSNEGGELKLYELEIGQLLNTVLPEANTCVCFFSDRFPHEVLSSQRDRLSISGWFKIRA